MYYLCIAKTHPTKKLMNLQTHKLMSLRTQKLTNLHRPLCPLCPLLKISMLRI